MRKSTMERAPRADESTNEELEFLRARLEGAEALLAAHRGELSTLERELTDTATEMVALNAALCASSDGA